MPLMRGHHTHESHFTQIPNAWLRDVRLSYKARGLLAELLSHRPGFTVSRDRLARLGRDGKDAISTAIAELEAHGYLSRKQERNENGTLGPTVWITQDPHPSADYPAAAYPAAGNPLPKNTNHEKTSSKKDSPTADAAGASADAFESFWKSYPRKVDKLAARKAFMKAWMAAGDAVVAGAHRLAADPNLPPKQFIPYPATWLNAGGWENEPYPERELSPDEKLARAKQEAARKRALELERSAALRAEAEEMKRTAAPAPRCKHDKPLPLCIPCSKALAGES